MCGVEISGVSEELTQIRAVVFEVGSDSRKVSHAWFWAGRDFSDVVGDSGDLEDFLEQSLNREGDRTVVFIAPSDIVVEGLVVLAVLDDVDHQVLALHVVSDPVPVASLVSCHQTEHIAHERAVQTTVLHLVVGVLIHALVVASDQTFSHSCVVRD